MYLPYSLKFTTNKWQLFQSNSFSQFQYEWVSLDVNEVCFKEEQDIPIQVKNKKKVKPLLNDVDVGNVVQCTEILST